MWFSLICSLLSFKMFVKQLCSAKSTETQIKWLIISVIIISQPCLLQHSLHTYNSVKEGEAQLLLSNIHLLQITNLFHFKIKITIPNLFEKIIAYNSRLKATIQSIGQQKCLGCNSSLAEIIYHRSQPIK